MKKITRCPICKEFFLTEITLSYNKDFCWNNNCENDKEYNVVKKTQK